MIEGSSMTLQMISVPAYPKPTASRELIFTIVFCKILGSVGSILPSYSSIFSRHIFFSSIYLMAFRGLIAIFLTVSIISSSGAMAVNSRSEEKKMVVVMSRKQTKMVLAMLNAATILL